MCGQVLHCETFLFAAPRTEFSRYFVQILTTPQRIRFATHLPLVFIKIPNTDFIFYIFEPLVHGF